MKKFITIIIALLILPAIGFSQEKAKDTVIKEKLERPAFESSSIIDNATDVVLRKNAMEVQFVHRFGIIDWDNPEDLAGIYGPQANMRMGIAYGIVDRFTLGIGYTKNKRLLDLNWKVAILRQTRSNKMPINLTYYGNVAYSAEDQDKSNPRYSYQHDRLSYFHQLIISRRFTPAFSLQVAPSISHYNTVENVQRNDMVAIAVGGRVKVSPGTSILVDYSQPLTKFYQKNPHPGFSLGVEFGTSAHAFQIFITNYNKILPQSNYMFNQNDFFNGDILIGFNMTRIYNF